MTEIVREMGHGVPRKTSGAYLIGRQRLHHVLRLMIVLRRVDLVREGSMAGMLVRDALQHLL